MADKEERTSKDEKAGADGSKGAGRASPEAKDGGDKPKGGPAGPEDAKSSAGQDKPP